MRPFRFQGLVGACVLTMRARLIVVLVVACGLHEAVDRAVADLAAVLDPVLDGLAKVEPDEDAREAVLVL